MFYFNTLNLNQISGGNQIKQGDLGSTFTYNLADEKGRELDVFNQKTAYVNLVLDNNIVFTTTVIVDGSTVTFNIDKAIPVGLYFLEIKIDSYIFPSDRQTIILVTAGAVAYDLKELVPNYDTNMTITGILSDLSQKGIDITDLKTRLEDIDLSKAEKTQADSIQGQVNALVLGAVGDGNNAEVVQSKVDSFGSTFGTLKEHFDNVELMIKSNKTEIKRSDWFLAVYNAGTGTATPYGLAETLVSPILSFGSMPKLDFLIDEGYRITIGMYSDATGTFVSNSGWYTGQFNFSLKSDKFYRLVIGKVSGGKAQLSFSDAVTITSTFENEVTDMRKNIFGGAFETANDRVNALEDIIATAKLEIKYQDWFIGVYNGVTGTVTGYGSAQTIATNVKATTNISGLSIKPETGYKVYVAYYGSDGVTLVGNSGWFTSETFINVGEYDNIRFLIGKVDGSVATADFKNHVTISIDFRPVFAKIDNPPYHLNLPPKLYALVGKEMNVYFDNLMIDDADKYDFFVKTTLGKQQSERWTVTPTVAATTAITFQLYKDAADRGNPLTEAVTSLVVAPTTSGSGLTKTYLQIGDSTTKGMIETGELQALFGADAMNLTQIGTQGTAPNKHEGYPTKTTEYVTTQTALANGGVFDFENYMTTQGYAGVDYVGIHLGINDMYQWQSDAGANGQITATLARFEEMVASIHAYNPAIKIGFLVTIPPAKTEESFANDTGMTRWRYKRNVLLLAAKIIKQFKNREANNVYLVPFNCNLDTLNNFGSNSVAVNSRNTTLVTRQNNALHPNNNGYAQMADTVYYWLKNMV